MKRSFAVGFILLGLTMFVGLAFSDYNITDRGTYKSNATSGAKVDSYGNAYVTDASRDRDRIIKYDSIINDTTAVGMADSSSIAFDTHDVARGFLYIRATPTGGDSATVSSITLSVRVYGHTAAVLDSASRYNFPIASRSTGTLDSLWYSMGTAVSRTNYASPTEYRVTIVGDNNTSGQSMAWSRPNTIIVPLRDATGSWLWSEYMSVVVKVVSISRTGVVPSVNVSYRGVAL